MNNARELASLPTLSGSRALIVLAYVALTAIILAGLFWAQSVLIPLALGILFTTIATPIVKRLERFGFSRIPAVGMVTVGVLLACAAAFWLVYSQTTQLLVDLPNYQSNIIAKIDQVKNVSHTSWREDWDRLSENINHTINGTPQTIDQHVGETDPVERDSSSEVNPSQLSAGAAVVVATVGGTAGYFALAAVIAMFLLIDHEDFRNRIILLIGRGQITRTTKALDDAAQRISRFLLVQALINASFGVVLAIGLSCLQVKYALLWGVIAAVFRYIPYVGGSIATIFPTLLALAQFPSWWPAATIIGLVVCQELIINNVVEPRVFGQSIGVSSVALIVAAAFWTFLWGPVGLIMAGPLTVCLVVLGQYVPPLRFLGILLGNQPPMETEFVLYQRLLARDEVETQRIIEDAVREKGIVEAYDELVFPAAAAAALDCESGLLTEDDEKYVCGELDGVMEICMPAVKSSEIGTQRARILLVAARDVGDRTVASALSNTLDSQKYELIEAPDGLMDAEILALAKSERIAGVCIVSLPPGGLSHTKYLCKRLRINLPQVKIFVGHMQLQEANRNGWAGIDADAICHSLQELLHQLSGWEPALSVASRVDTAVHSTAAGGPHTAPSHQLVANE